MTGRRCGDARPYGWLMTNYWETNFEASLGGFHEFNYRVEFGSHLADPNGAIRHCRTLNHGLKPFRIRPDAAQILTTKSTGNTKTE